MKVPYNPQPDNENSSPAEYCHATPGGPAEPQTCKPNYKQPLIDHNGIANTFPADMRKEKKWVAWKSIPKGDGKKPTKMPISPATGEPAKVNDQTTWTTFEAALQYARENGLSGVMYAICADSRLFGIDFDNCIDEHGKLNPIVLDFARRLGGYVEVSPSGNGIKVFLECPLKMTSGKKRKTDDYEVEVYPGGRFFTTTGITRPDLPFSTLESPGAAEVICEALQMDEADLNPQSSSYKRNRQAQKSISESRLRDALASIPSDDYPDWLDVLFGIKNWAAHTGNDSTGKELWHEWSSTSAKYDPAEAEKKWEDASAEGKSTDKTITARTILRMARLHEAADTPTREPGRELNYRRVQGTGSNSSRMGREAIPYDEALRRLLEVAGDRLIAIGGELFGLPETKGEELIHLSSASRMFAFIGVECCDVNLDWATQLHGAMSKSEAYHAMAKRVKQFDYLETVPQEPLLPSRFYWHKDLPDPDYDALQELLDFSNPATPLDEGLILAMYMTPFWGENLENDQRSLFPAATDKAVEKLALQSPPQA